MEINNEWFTYYRFNKIMDMPEVIDEEKAV